MHDLKRQFAITEPCSNCPFRKDDKAIELAPGRKQKIIENLYHGHSGAFPCHKTVYRKDNRNFDDDDNFIANDVSQCAGAMAVCEKSGRKATIVQLGERLGIISDSHYSMAKEMTIDPEELDIVRKF